MRQLVRNVKISGSGSYVPEKVVTNEYLETIIFLFRIDQDSNL